MPGAPHLALFQSHDLPCCLATRLLLDPLVAFHNNDLDGVRLHLGPSHNSRFELICWHENLAGLCVQAHRSNTCNCFDHLLDDECPRFLADDGQRAITATGRCLTTSRFRHEYWGYAKMILDVLLCCLSSPRSNRPCVVVAWASPSWTTRPVGRDCTGQPSFSQRGLLDSAHRRAVARPASGLRWLEEHASPFLPLARSGPMGEAARTTHRRAGL